MIYTIKVLVTVFITPVIMGLAPQCLLLSPSLFFLEVPLGMAWYEPPIALWGNVGGGAERKGCWNTWIGVPTLAPSLNLGLYSLSLSFPFW